MPTPTETGYSLLEVLTVIAAWWGALLATSVFIWNIKIQKVAARDKQERHAWEDKQARMDAVLEKYMDFRKRQFTEGPDGLQKAGIATLESDAEIRELADHIIANNEPDPLRRNLGLFKQDMDFKIFYDYAAKERFNFFKGNLDEAIKKSGALRK